MGALERGNVDAVELGPFRKAPAPVSRVPEESYDRVDSGNDRFSYRQLHSSPDEVASIAANRSLTAKPLRE